MTGLNTHRVLVVATFLLGAVLVKAAVAAAVIYSNPAYQSPIGGEPDDLLLLPGYGFAADDAVVYQAITDDDAALHHPTVAPAGSTAEAGTMPVVSAANAPYSLTVRIPIAMHSTQSYAVWVVDRDGGWSNAARINDPRPFWISPAYVYATSAQASLPREVKVIGRNLQRSSESSIFVRFSGPDDLTLPSVAEGAKAEDLNRYVARVQLPARLKPGDYTVAVSRDRAHWVPLNEQRLEVRSDPPPPRLFSIDDPAFGGCRPGDGTEALHCIRRAIEAAAAAGGGTVAIGPGRWNLVDAGSAGDSNEGVALPRGVNLIGAGSDRTCLYRVPSSHAAHPLFLLFGQNRVEGIAFEDGRRYVPADAANPALQLGPAFYRVSAGTRASARIVDDVVVADNIFKKTHPAIASGGLPIKHLFIVGNLFGAYDEGLALGGNRYNVTYSFTIEDSVIAHNVFKPGSYMDLKIGQGAIASELGASHRLDFSDNTAEGSSTEFLDFPDDARGWRAGFFWNMNGNHEMLLVAGNKVTCSGDKDGDGEAIAYDANGDTFAFPNARTVVASTANSITVEGSLRVRQNERDVDVANYYIGHWLNIAQGRGLGQSRKIRSYRSDPVSGEVTFTVSPAWDTVPEAGVSRASVGWQYWQIYTLGNEIDQRRPLCLKSNRTRARGGGIVQWAQTSDSVIAGNRQYDTDGIALQQTYSAEDPACPQCTAEASYTNFIEIRDNLVDGEYNWNSDCSWSGIQAAQSASPTPRSPPPVISYGVSIAHNTVIRADGLRGGAIATPLTWYQGPPPHDWTLVDNLLIHHNTIRDIAGPSADRQCERGYSAARTGINLFQAETVWRTVLYANRCQNVAVPLYDSGRGSVRVCDRVPEDSCECARK